MPYSANISYFYIIMKEGKGSDTNSFRERGWLKLDNAAKLFPAIAKGELTAVFRITATLKKPVNYSAIKEAVDKTSKRFPYFSVSLGSGLFWHFLEFNDRPPRIQAEEEIPCTAFAVKRRNELLYRILVKSNRISVEFIHILTDGAGALEYLKSLLYSYFGLTGNTNIQTEGIILPDTPISDEEAEDGYNKFFRRLPPPAKLVKAWHLPFELNIKPRLRVIRAEIKTDEILALSRSHKVSVTEYFTSVYLFSLQKIFLAEKQKGKKQKKNILRVEVPVNMRNKFPSKTMRNFSLFVMPEIDLRLGIYTFEEILKKVHNDLQSSTDVKEISRFLSSNVSYEKHPLVRILPLFIKEVAIEAVYRGLGSKRCTGIVTNLGSVNLPEGIKEMVDSFDLIPTPPNSEVKVDIALISYNNRFRINFCNITRSSELEQLILKHLSESGIHVKVLNNN